MKEDRTHLPREQAGCSGEPAYLLREGGAGLYTDGTNLFFVNESGSTEQLTTL
jgi:hypothetical protein